MASYWDRIKPWECAACGQKNISANKTACPKCHTGRDGSAPAPEPVAVPTPQPAPQPARVAMQTTTREYESEKDVRHGIEHMAQDGWTVTSQSSYTPKKGITRTVAGGMLFFNPKPRHLVTFTRER